jgi:hypothetical protein
MDMDTSKATPHYTHYSHLSSHQSNKTSSTCYSQMIPKEVTNTTLRAMTAPPATPALPASPSMPPHTSLLSLLQRGRARSAPTISDNLRLATNQEIVQEGGNPPRPLPEDSRFLRPVASSRNLRDVLDEALRIANSRDWGSADLRDRDRRDPPHDSSSSPAAGQ